MSLIALWSEDFIDISYDEQESWLYVNWKGYQTDSSVQQGCERMLELMVEHHTDRILNDNTHVEGIWTGASAWVATDWFPRITQAGLRYFAWVYSPSRFSQVSTDTTLSLLDTPAVSVEVFYTLAEAQTWLRQRPVV